MTDQTTNLGLPLMAPNQDQPNVIYNAAMAILDSAISGSLLITDGSSGSPTIQYGGTELIFLGATITQPSAGVVQIDVGRAVHFQLSLSDLTTDLTTGTSKAYFRAPHGFTLTGVRSSLIDASSSGLVTVDINVNGSTILSTKLSIDATEKTSTTAATPAVISNSTITDDAEITFDIDAAGNDAKGLIVTLLGTRT